MEFSGRFLFCLVTVQCLLFHSLVQGEDLCGNSTNKNSCLQSCYDGCMERVDKEDSTKGEIKESIATQTNLCVNKCHGIAFFPLKKEDLPKLPLYSDGNNCLGRCSYPLHTEYCLKGYISGFFYCDCHKCCLQMTDTDTRNKCIHTCYLWFLRQWAPIRACRFRPENANSPKTYCTDFCIFQVLRQNQSLSWKDVPDIKANYAATCIKRCTSMMTSGVRIDHGTEAVPCTNLSTCVTITAFKWKVFASYHLDYNYVLSKIQSRRRQISSFAITNSFLEPLTGGGPYTSCNIHPSMFEIKRDTSMDNLHNLGVPIRAESDANNHIEYPQVVEKFLPWEDYGDALVTAYNYSYNPKTFWGQGFCFHDRRMVKAEPCTRYESTSYARIAEGVRLDHEVKFKVTDAFGLFPLTAGELKNVSAQSPEWQNLEFVGNFDDSTIIMKGKGYMQMQNLVSIWFLKRNA